MIEWKCPRNFAYGTIEGLGNIRVFTSCQDCNISTCESKTQHQSEEAKA